MKILRIITRLNVGGPSLQAIDLNRELEKKGHDTLLLSGLVDRSNREKRIEYKKYDWILNVPSLKREINWENDWKAFKHIKTQIKLFKPDIVHSHMAKAGAITRLAVLSMPKAERPKTVHTYHGHTFHSYWGKTKGFIFRNIERFLNKRTDRIIAISQSQYDDLVYKYKVCSAEQTRIIPLGFDLSELLEVKEKKNDIYLNVGIIGRLNDIKCHELFFDFIRELTKVRCRKIVRGFVIGDGERKEYLNSTAPKNVTFTGWRGHNQVIEYLKALDIIVCTSKNEGTPASLIEAMAAGRFVISTPVGGCIDLLGDSYYFKPDEAERGLYLTDLSLTISVLEHMLTTGTYKKKIIKAREYVKRNHSLDKLVDNIENLYKELLNE